MRTSTALPAAFGAIALLTGCGAATSSAAAPRRAPPYVATTTASRGVLTPSSTMGGLVAPAQIVTIASTLVDPVATVNVQEGDVVHRGDVLATIDVTDLRAQRDSLRGSADAAAARAHQATAQAGLTVDRNANGVLGASAARAAAVASLANDRRNYDRLSGLLAQGYVSAQAVDAARTTVATAAQPLASADAALASARSQADESGSPRTGLLGATVAAARGDAVAAAGQLEQIESQIAKATIVAPIDAVVVNRDVDPGEYPGSRTLFVLHADRQDFAILNGSAAQVAGIRRGDRAAIATSDGRTADGTVVGVLDPVTPGTTNFVVKVALAARGAALRPGDVVSGRIALPVRTGVRVPVTAFLDDSHTTLQTVVAGKVRTLPVRERAEEGRLAIVDGISSGTPIVVDGQVGLRDGQSVTVDGRHTS